MDKIEQIKAIVNGDVWGLVEKYNFEDTDDLSKAWTVTKSDVLEYVRQENFMPHWINAERSLSDGVYLLRQSGEYITFFQDRGKVEGDTVMQHSSFDEARSYLISELCHTYKIT